MLWAGDGLLVLSVGNRLLISQPSQLTPTTNPSKKPIPFHLSSHTHKTVSTAFLPPPQKPSFLNIKNHTSCLTPFPLSSHPHPSSSSTASRYLPQLIEGKASALHIHLFPGHLSITPPPHPPSLPPPQKFPHSPKTILPNHHHPLPSQP